MLPRDSHIHSPYCPHGSADTMKAYAEKAAASGFDSMTFTEHAPLPPSFTDPVPDRSSAMALQDLESYLDACEKIKRSYQNDITVLTGLEVDYIDGFQDETAEFLNQWGPHLDDSILSVHFLTVDRKAYTCLDFSPESFQSFIHEAGTLEDVYMQYYDTVIRSIEADLGRYKPVRAGHITLVRKFQQLFPRSFDDGGMITNVLKAVNAAGMSLDINGAGLYKAHCSESYPPEEMILSAKKQGIPLIYGSDAHHVSEIGQGYETIHPLLR